jgi:ribosomal-protein-alanine N-acetyltransferase
MTMGDLDRVLEIERLSYSNPWRPSSFVGEMENPPFSNPFVIVLEPEKSIIGYIIYWHIKDEVQISNIALHADYRGMGIGEAVLRRVMDMTRRNGGKYIFLEVRPSNNAAKSLYRKLGFRMMGIRRGYYYNPPEDAILMGRLL